MPSSGKRALEAVVSGWSQGSPRFPPGSSSLGGSCAVHLPGQSCEVPSWGHMRLRLQSSDSRAC